MEKIWNFFENLNEFVYVSDVDTYDLVYMNRKTRENFGFQTQEEIKGKKCYEVMQHNAAPCSMCNNQELVEGEFKEWKYYNPVLGKHLLLKDTMLEQDGRRYRVEIALDVSNEEKQGSLIQNYENMEAIINEGIRISLNAPTSEQSLEIILEYLGKALNGERTYIFEKNLLGNDDNTYEGQKIIGFYGVDNPPEKMLDYTSNMLQIMGYFIVSSIRRRNLVRELERMSYSDQLTKLGNRFAMEQYVTDASGTSGFGVVYCDITGLKRVNDTLGHQAGDQLILRAGELLREEFSDYGLFRIGGDELLALCAGIGEEELKQRIERMKAGMKKKDVVMAVGSVWQESWERGFDLLLMEAERRMYQEKAAYYNKAGIDRRH